MTAQTSFPIQIRRQSDLLAWESKIDDCLGRLTLEEKVAQLHQAPIPGPAEKLLETKGLGSALFAGSAFAGHQNDRTVSWNASIETQRKAIRHGGLPLLIARDVIHGHHTVFPIPLGQAAAWDPAMVEASQRIAAMEAAADGLHWAFSPVADIGRDPRWGRVAEGYGEDPVLSAELTAAAVRGFQQADYPVLACLKHYAAYGAAEGGRDYARAGIGRHEFREVYLPSFRSGVEAGAATVMAAFNEVDGVPATSNRELLREILKEEYSFHGVVVSDWNAIEELICHGVAADRRDAARLAIEAGIDIDMVSGCYHEHLAGLVRAGVVKESLVDDAVRRVLRAKFAMNLFDDPFREQFVPMAPDPKGTLELAREFARETYVLLKNKGAILPLKERASIVLAGPFAEAREELFGTWTCDGRSEWVVSIADALKAATKAEVRVASIPESVVEYARGADVVIALLGEHPMRSGEAHCIAELTLPPGQQELLRSIARSGKPLVTVVFTGRPLALSEACEMSDALMIGWHPGSSGGPALADLLLGKASPSGRLPCSFPQATGQIPVHYSQHPTGRPLTPPMSRYLDLPDRALFPFGSGLAYSDFELSDLRVDKTQTGGWKIFASVTNTGTMSATVPLQLYVRDLVASRSRPCRELKRFSRVQVEPGGHAVAEFCIAAEDLAFSQPDGTWAAEPGEFRVWVGLSSVGGLEGALFLE